MNGEPGQTQAEAADKNDGERRLLPPSLVTSRAGLRRLEAEWRGLALASPLATVFQTWEWNAVWWRHYGGRLRRRLRILCFRSAQDGSLVGLAPLCVSLWYGSPLRRLSFLGTGTSDYLDLLAAPGWEDIAAQSLYAELGKRRGWDVADFQQLREGGVLHNRLPNEGAKLAWHDAPLEACPFLKLSPDWDAQRQQFGKKTRSNIGYYDRALQKVYTVEVGVVSPEGDLDGEMTRLFDLHQRRWNQRWMPGVFGSRRVRRFHREAARALLGQNALRLYSLKLDGVTQASLYCFVFGDRTCYYQGGFEPTLAKWSLGTVLTARVLQDAIAEGRTTFDFLRGAEPYKAKWTQTACVNHRRLLVKHGALGLPRLTRQVQAWEWAAENGAKTWVRKRTEAP